MPTCFERLKDIGLTVLTATTPCGARHKRNIITHTVVQAYSWSSDVTAVHFRPTRDLNPDFIFAPHQCEDRSLSNHTLRGIKIICLIQLDEKLQKKEEKNFFELNILATKVVLPNRKTNNFTISKLGETIF